MGNEVLGVILDFDDTIVQLSAERWEKFRVLLRSFGLNDSELAGVERRRGRSFHRLVGRHITGYRFEAFLSAYLEVLADVPPRGTPGAVSAIKLLRESGVLVVVLSSSHSLIVKQDLAALGVTVNAVFGADDAVCEKPDPSYLSAAMDYMARNGVWPMNVISVGDAVDDYRMSRSVCGFKAVLTGVASRADFVAAGLRAESIFADLPCLVRAIGSERGWA